MMDYVRGTFFVVQMYLVMALMALVYTPLAVFTRSAAFAGVHHYTAYVRWSARFLIGLRSEVRGTVPTGEVLICSKHQSFFDIIMLVSVLPKPKFIMKKELQRVPIIGFYARRIGCVPVDRGRRSEAIHQMKAGVAAGRDLPGQLIIYPQGSRIPPGEKRPYKVGAGVLYDALDQTCIPAATNVGVFWPRTGVRRSPGLAVVEFLDPIPPGLPMPEFMERLEDVVETASDQLLEEARGVH